MPPGVVDPPTSARAGVSPMVTFNEPSENVRGMSSFVHSCEFSPGANNKLLLSSLIKR